MLIILLLSLIIFIIIKTFKVYDFLNSEKILKCKNDYIRSMKSIVLFGAGNVALHLCKAINNSKNFQVIQVYSKTKKTLDNFNLNIDKTNDLGTIKQASVYIIAISDDSIIEFSKKIPFKNRLVVHTSGSVGMAKLSGNNRRGVFYPLQTFTSNAKINFLEIPMCIEADNQEDLNVLEKLGRSISNNVQVVTSTQREHIHLSAVIVNNFVNHLYHMGHDLLHHQSLTFDILKPLIIETASKIKTLRPFETQTGPARRNDLKTIEKQLHLLKDSPYQEIYKNITNSILEKYKN